MACSFKPTGDTRIDLFSGPIQRDRSPRVCPLFLLVHRQRSSELVNFVECSEESVEGHPERLCGALAAGTWQESRKHIPSLRLCAAGTEVHGGCRFRPKKQNSQNAPKGPIGHARKSCAIMTSTVALLHNASCLRMFPSAIFVNFAITWLLCISIAVSFGG